MRENCTVCNHPQCPQIEAEFRQSGLFVPVAEKYGLGVGNLYEHVDAHTPRPVQANAGAESESAVPPPDPVAEPAAFQSAITRLARIALELVEAAVRLSRNANGEIVDVRQPARALQEAVRQLGFVARIFTPHKQPKSVQEKFVNTAEWGRLRTLILEAIWPFPDARAAVSAAMEQAQA